VSSGILPLFQWKILFLFFVNTKCVPNIFSSAICWQCIIAKHYCFQFSFVFVARILIGSGYCWLLPVKSSPYDHKNPVHTVNDEQEGKRDVTPQTLVSFKKYMPPPLPYFKVKICPFPLPHFASIFSPYLWSFRWPNYIVTLPRYFSFRLPHLNIPTVPPSDELDKNIQRTSLRLLFSHWNGYSHFRFALDFSYAFGVL
jgi:hypothetical protein